MKHKTWFRLVLKAIGVLLFCLGLTEFCGLVLYMIGAVLSDDTPTLDIAMFLYQFGYVIGSSVGGMVIGAFLMSSSEFIVERIIPSNRPYCPSCGYELKGLAGPSCPECGVALPDNVRTNAGDSGSDA